MASKPCAQNAGAANDRRRPSCQRRPPLRRKSRKRRAWPYALLLLVAWGAIFGAVFWSHFLSDLPDTTKLLVKGESHDVTILDDQGRLIARRGLTQGARVDVSRLPDYVPNAFIAIEDRRFRSHFGRRSHRPGARRDREHGRRPCPCRAARR